MPSIKKDEIESLIPHSGSMCLNDEVLHWDAKTLQCISRTHLADDNPLRKNNRLSNLHVIEYAAQAMAIHGGLLARKSGIALPAGYIAAVRNIEFTINYLDDVKSELLIYVEQIIAQAGNLIYEFHVTAIENESKIKIASGRIIVMQAEDINSN